MYSRIQELPQYRGVDIAVLGSSRAYRGLDPRYFSAHNLKFFNLGSSSQTPIQSLYLANRYLDTLKPKLVLIEVFPKGFGLDGVESTLDIIANDRLNKQAIEMAFRMNHIKVYNALLVDIFRTGLGVNDGFIESVRKNEDTYISGGYVERDLEYNKRLEANEPREIEFRSDQIQALKNLVELIRKSGAEVVLYEAPCARVLYESIINRSEMEAIHRELATYVNFNERLQLNDSLHFYDQSHLNIKGVKIFNEAMIDWLDEEGYVAKMNREKPSIGG